MGFQAGKGFGEDLFGTLVPRFLAVAGEVALDPSPHRPWSVRLTDLCVGEWPGPWLLLPSPPPAPRAQMAANLGPGLPPGAQSSAHLRWDARTLRAGRPWPQGCAQGCGTVEG